ncbi:hypothetical protein D9M71_747370 [compost metagenome]
MSNSRPITRSSPRGQHIANRLMGKIALQVLQLDDFRQQIERRLERRGADANHTVERREMKAGRNDGLFDQFFKGCS